VLSLFGSLLVQYALFWYVTLETKSGWMMTVYIICGFVPAFLMAPFAGVWADRMDRKKLIVLSDAMIAVATLALAVVFMVGGKTLWLVMLTAAVRSLGQAVQGPAVGALLPQFVPQDQLTRVNGISSMLQSGMTILSPVLAGSLLTMWPMEQVFFLDVGTAALAIALLVFFLEVPPHEKAGKPQTVSYFGDLKLGFRYIVEALPQWVASRQQAVQRRVHVRRGHWSHGCGHQRHGNAQFLAAGRVAGLVPDERVRDRRHAVTDRLVRRVQPGVGHEDRGFLQHLDLGVGRRVHAGKEARGVPHERLTGRCASQGAALVPLLDQRRAGSREDGRERGRQFAADRLLACRLVLALQPPRLDRPSVVQADAVERARPERVRGNGQDSGVPRAQVRLRQSVDEVPGQGHGHQHIPVGPHSAGCGLDILSRRQSRWRAKVRGPSGTA